MPDLKLDALKLRFSFEDFRMWKFSGNSKNWHMVESHHLHKAETLKQKFASIYTKNSLAIKTPLDSSIVSIPQSSSMIVAGILQLFIWFTDAQLEVVSKWFGRTKFLSP